MGHGVGACFSSFFGGEKNKYWRREQSMVFLVWLCGLGLEFWIIIFTLLSPYYYFWPTLIIQDQTLWLVIRYLKE